MTVSTTDSVEEYVSGGPAFPIPYRFLQNSDIEAVLVRQNGTSETLVLGTQYTLSGAGSQNGGTLTSSYAAGILATPGAVLTISRVMDAVQPTDLRNQGKFLAETHEAVFDRLTMLIQQGFAGLSRALVRPIGKNYYDAEGRQIKNLDDPTDNQDAVNKLWAQQYIGSVIGGIQGPINNSANILYQFPDGTPHVVQDLAESIGATGIGYRNGTIASFLDLQFPVNAYGADPEGIEDSTAAIQAAVDAANTYGGTVTGVGTFRVDNPIYVDSGTTIYMPGVILKATAALDARCMFYAKHADAAGYAGANRLHFYGFMIDLSASPLSGGIGVAHARDVTFERLRFTGAGGTFHYLDICACSNVRVIGCTVLGTQVGTAVQIDGAESGSLPGTLEPLNEDGTRCRDVEISGNYFDSCVNAAVHLHKNGHQRVIIANNRFYWCQNAVVDDPGYPAAPGNAYLVIVGNTVRSNDAPNANLQGNGFNLQSGITDFIIAGNSLATYYWPIVIQANSLVAGRINQGVISGNTCRSTARGAISVAAGDGIGIHDNKAQGFALGYSGIVYVGREAEIHDNNVVGLGTGAAAGTAAIHATTNRTSIRGNISKGTNRGIIVLATSAADPDMLDVSFNQIISALSNGIEISGSGGEQVRGLTVVGNTFNGASIAGNAILVTGARGLSVSLNQIHGLAASTTGILLVDCGQGSVTANTIAATAKSGQTGIEVTVLGYLSVSGNTLLNLDRGYVESGGAGNSTVGMNVSINTTTDWVLGGGSVNGTGGNINV